jgi:Cu+-exporting ATPase
MPSGWAGMMNSNAVRSKNELEHQKTGEIQAVSADSDPNVALTNFCRHCGLPCVDRNWFKGEDRFCCAGCLTVFELLTENGLTDFYNLSAGENMSLNRPVAERDFSFLDVEETRVRLVDFTDARTTRVTLHLESIHCVACVWLLENLPRLHPAILEARVNFSRRDLAVRFDTRALKLGDLAGLLTSLGYEPELNLGRLDRVAASPVQRRLYLQVGVAGFAFGNVMLLSFAAYLGLESGALAGLIGWASLLLALPVVFYSAADYWRSALLGLKQGRLVIEVPIVLGLGALFGRSVWEVVTGAGEGYFDSLAGFVFFLLIGRIFQQKTYDRLSFERDYRSFFPLSVCRMNGSAEERVALSAVEVGDRLLIRHGELIPADAILSAGEALIDYSFVTGEADPVGKARGEHVFAGGRQCGGAIEVVTVKPVSQSYLASLWNAEAFGDEHRAERESSFDSLTNRFSPWFTAAVVAIAFVSAFLWLGGDAGKAVTAFTSVLIVACPCALALAAPFALGTAQRVLGARSIFLKRPAILEKLAKIDTVVFDKTGTLTTSRAECWFHGAPLDDRERRAVRAVLASSTHPHARRVVDWARETEKDVPVFDFVETAGMGVSAVVESSLVLAGSAAWLRNHGVAVDGVAGVAGSVVHVAIGGRWRGFFEVRGEVRPEIRELAQALRGRFRLALLSGDNEREAARFASIFGVGTDLRFNQSPADKLEFIQGLQGEGATVMMVGDGLNDAGALRQADVGVAVVEDTARFSPASDLIIEGGRVGELARLLTFGERSVNVVRICLAVSVLYNLTGLWFAARGILSPVVCAVLMPLSSITVVALAGGLSLWSARIFSARTAASGAIDPVALALKAEVPA